MGTKVGVGEFKDRFSLTRKLAIPILEWLDSQRVTVRTGNRRRVLMLFEDLIDRAMQAHRLTADVCPLDFKGQTKICRCL